MTRHEEIWQQLTLGYLRRAHAELGQLLVVLERLERASGAIDAMREDVVGQVGLGPVPVPARRRRKR